MVVLNYLLLNPGKTEVNVAPKSQRNSLSNRIVTLDNVCERNSQCGKEPQSCIWATSIILSPHNQVCKTAFFHLQNVSVWTLKHISPFPLFCILLLWCVFFAIHMWFLVPYPLVSVISSRFLLPESDGPTTIYYIGKDHWRSWRGVTVNPWRIPTGNLVWHLLLEIPGS